MEIFFLLVILFLLCLTAIFLTKITIGGNIWFFSPTVIFIAYFLMRDFGGVAVASVNISNIRPILGFITAIFAVNLAAISIGFVTLKKSVKIQFNNIGDPKIFYFFIFLGIFSIIFTFYMLGRIPLLYAFSSIFDGNVDISMHEARRMNTLEHRDGDTIYFGQGYFRIIYTIISPFFLCLLMLYQTVKFNLIKKSTKLLIIFFIISATLNGQIWLAVNQIILYFIFYIFSKQLIGSTNIRKIILITIFSYISILLFIFSFRYLQTISGRDIEDFIFSTFSRIYFYPQADLFLLFPDQHPFRYGSTWLTDLIGLLPGSIQSFSYEVHYLIHGGGWGYTLSPGFIASAYVNFGYFGIFFFVYLLTIFFMFLFIFLINSKSLILKGIAILISYSFAINFGAEIASFVVIIITSLLIYLSYTSLELIQKHLKHK